MTNDEISALDKLHIWHPCSQMMDYEAYPAVPIERAEGVWLYRKDGTRILDAIASWWVSIFGHGNEKIKNRLKQQLDSLSHVIFANYTHEPAAELTVHLAKLFDGKLPKAFFTDNGSSAVEAALKMSFHYWYNTGKPEKIKFFYLQGAYHGETLGALAVGSLDLYKRIYTPMLMQNSIEVPGPDCYRCAYGCTRDSCQAECFVSMQQAFEQHAETAAAVIVEPIIQCAAGMNIYPPLYLSKLRALCTARDIHLICDEIASGFGRTGQMLASYHAHIVPDMVLLSKTITGGFLPLAVILTSNTIYQAFYAPYVQRKAFMHSHSYAGSALACAAACAVFELFGEEGVFDRIRATGRAIRDRLLPLLEHKHVGEIRSIGIVSAVELVKDKKSKAPFDWQERTGYRIYREAESKGVLLRNLGDILYFAPAYIINEEEIDFMTRIAIESICKLI